MKKSFYLCLALMLSVLLVTGCQNPIEKVVDNAKDKVEEKTKDTDDKTKDSDDKTKNITDKTKDQDKKTVNTNAIEKLVCTISENENNMKMDMKVSLDYDNAANLPKNISMEMNMNVGSEMMEAFKASGMDFCTMFSEKDKFSGKCTSSVTKDSVKLTYEISDTEMSKMIKSESNDEIHTFAELKASFEKEGFKCN